MERRNIVPNPITGERDARTLDVCPGYTRAQRSRADELALAHLSHKDLANRVRMLMRDDLDHEIVCAAARDRIAWLAARVEELEAAER